MNVYDSNCMEELLAPLGYKKVKSPEDADMVILNTCHIREKATEKVFSELGRMNLIKQMRENDGKEMTLAVAGCVAQAEGDEIARRAPYVDMIFGPQSYHRLPEMIAKSRRVQGLVLDTSFPADSKFDYLPLPNINREYSAFLTVQEGCDKFCTFCVVPYTRGVEYSRPPAEILLEANSLVKVGVREITLLGQNVNNYRSDVGKTEWGLGRLIRELAEISGLDRIRYTTNYPADVTDELISAHRDVPSLMPFIHLPVQSGSNKVLVAMNRRHNIDSYRRLVDALKNARSDIALSSDFIVGFPGEKESDFADSLNLIKEIGFSQAFSFKYSSRPGTPASLLPDQVPDKEKNERLKRLQDLLKTQQYKFNQECVGQKMQVLLERKSARAGQLVGRSQYMQPVHVLAEELMIGKIVNLQIIEGMQYSLNAALNHTSIKDSVRVSS